jgi:methyl coenzyme M reductase subunit D
MTMVNRPALPASTMDNYLWFSSLGIDDLRRMRESVRRVQMKHFPDRHCSDNECDKLIVAVGPLAAENQLKHLVDSEQLAPKIFSGPATAKRADPESKRRRALSSAEYINLIAD